MIIFYDNRDGKIFSVIEGRVHPKQQLNMRVHSGTIPDSEIAKFVVPF